MTACAGTQAVKVNAAGADSPRFIIKTGDYAPSEKFFKNFFSICVLKTKLRNYISETTSTEAAKPLPLVLTEEFECEFLKNWLPQGSSAI